MKEGIKSVVVYFQPYCNHCHVLMQWLEEKHIPFTQKNILIPEYRNEFRECKGIGTPLTLISLENGEVKEVLGANKKQLAKLLNI